MSDVLLAVRGIGGSEPVDSVSMATSLPSTTDPARARRLAAWKGALAAGVPALLVVGLVPHLYTSLFPMLWEAMFALLPRALAPYLSLGVLFITPALLALPAALFGIRDRERPSRKRRPPE